MPRPTSNSMPQPATSYQKSLFAAFLPAAEPLPPTPRFSVCTQGHSQQHQRMGVSITEAHVMHSTSTNAMTSRQIHVASATGTINFALCTIAALGGSAEELHLAAGQLALQLRMQLRRLLGPVQRLTVHRARRILRANALTM